MKTIINTIPLLMLIFLLKIAGAQDVQRLYYAIEIDGVLCGYVTSDITESTYKGERVTETNDTVNLLLRALEQDVNAQIISRYLVTLESNKVKFNSTQMYHNGGESMNVTNEIHDAYILRNDLAGGSLDTVEYSSDVILNTHLSSAYLLEDFYGKDLKEKFYQVYDYMRGKISEHKLTFLRDEEITLAGMEFSTMVFEDYSPSDGLTTRRWVNTEDGLEVKFEVMNRVIALDDHTVEKRIKTVDLNNSIFAKVETKIPDFQEVRYMKVQANIRSGGEEITVESLNFPGQKFEGTVDNNHVVGIFEIEPIRYDGSNAPAFPMAIAEGEVPTKYLEPELLIESDHPMIIAKAKEITEGASDAWDAVVRLSTWVGNEVEGAVPGGTSAINTLRVMEGECGSHSRLLVAFCRATGFPARLSIGCMYSPWYGGSFGQHAWTEVYMGKEYGWIAVDATLLEYDYVDAGHIKLGERSSFNPEKMEILAYSLGEELSLEEEDITPEKYQGIVGPYINEENNDVLEVIYRDGGILVDIKGQMKLKLKEEDDEGRMYTEVTENVYFTFPEDKMVIVEKVHALKNISQETPIEEGTPENIKEIVGIYEIFQLQKEFRISWGKGKVYVLTPDNDKPHPLDYIEENERWKDNADNKEYSFNYDVDGKVTGMNIHVSSHLNKKLQ